MRDFKIRASAASKLLTAKGATSKGQTPKTYQKEWLISELTGKEKRIESKYFRRGNDMEDDSIKRIGKGVKNEKYFENDFFTGTPDILTEDTVIDAKTPWDTFTFPFFMTEPPIEYVAQLQVYMELTGRKKAELSYCLESGSEEQINSLMWSFAKEDETDEPTIEHYEKAEEELNYDHLAPELRIKTFKIDYDPKMIEALKEGVLLGREYIKELLKQINQ